MNKSSRDGRIICYSVGYASIYGRGKRFHQDYIPIKCNKSNRGWHPEWFYLRNHPEAAFPCFTGKVFEVAPESWKKSPKGVMLAWLRTLRDAIAELRWLGACGEGIVGAYHQRGVAPLMERRLPLWKMTEKALQMMGRARPLCWRQSCPAILRCTSACGTR